MAKQVGFIGLGRMGEPMALRLVAAGYELEMHRLLRDGDLSEVMVNTFEDIYVERSGKLFVQVEMREVRQLSVSGASDVQAPGPLRADQLKVLLALFTLALTWLAVIPGLTATSIDGASAFSYPLILLPFISSAFVPTATMPTVTRRKGWPWRARSATTCGSCSR